MNAIILVCFLTMTPVKAGEPVFIIEEVSEDVPDFYYELGSPENPSESPICLDDIDLTDVDFDFLDNSLEKEDKK